MSKTSRSERKLQYTYSPLILASGITVLGNVAPIQQFDAATRLYTPDYTSEHLQLAPWLEVTDPDGILTAAERLPSNIQWTAVEQSVETPILATTSGYSIATDGTLTVKRNVSPDYPLTLRCEFDHLDPRTSEIRHRTETILLHTDTVSDTPVIVLDTPTVIRYDPIRDTDTTRTIHASLYVGDTLIVAPHVQFIWQKRDEYDMVWADIDPDGSDIMDYDVSIDPMGKTLTINLPYIGRRIDLRVYALYNPFGAATSMSVDASTPMEQFSVVRYEATLSAEVDMPTRIPPSLKQIKPVAHIFDTKGEIASPDKHALISWRTATGKADGSLAWSSVVATGQKPTLSTSFLARLYGGTVKAEASVLQPLAALTLADGTPIVTADGSPILARPS